MSICPSKDIHSIFIDNELPDEFRSEYLAHVEICQKCKAELNSLKQLRYTFAQDKKNINLSQKKIDDSYKKLESLIEFKKVTSNATFNRFAPLINRMVPAVAAALLLICFLPIGMRQLKKQASELDIGFQNAGIENPFTSHSSAYELFANDNSLIRSTEFLTSNNLEHIIQDRTKNPNGNIFNNVANNFSSPITNNIDYQAEYFANVYNSAKNLYNREYTPFIGF